MRRIIKYFLFGVLLALISACYDSEDSDVTIKKGVAQTVTFTLNSSENSGGSSSTTDNENISSRSLTDNKNISSRSLTDNEENTLNTANVLAFVDDGAGNYSFSYRSPGRNIATLSPGTTRFKVDLKQYPNKQLFVILANSDSEIIDSDISIGEPLETALSKLVTSCSTEWPARNNGDALLRYIPMYGKTAGIVINSATTDVGSITLVRMLARIDVRVESTVTNFQLKEVCVFNRKDRGFIAYKDANWDNVNQLVTCADVPASVVTTKLNNILYQANSEHEVSRSIYTFEARGVTDKKDATAIVVGGYFNYQSKVSYYRVDIPAYDSSGKQLPGTMGDILRNHLYNVEIQKVTDNGYDNPEDAFDGGIKVDANIVPWNLATMDEVKYEGIYSLKVSRAVCSYLAGGASNEKLVIETDYQGSWEGILYPASATSWIQWHGGTVFNDKGNLTGIKGVTTLNFNVAANTTGQSRHAFLKIVVGGLTKYIDFYQTNLIGNVMDWVNDGSSDAGFDNDPLEGPYRLGVSRTNYSMSKNAVTGSELLISTDYPKGWTSSIEPAGTDWLTITENGTSSGPDSKILKFDLKENNTLGDRFARIIVKAGNLKKTIYVSQDAFSLSGGTIINLTPWDDRTGWDKDTQFDGYYSLSAGKTSYPLSKNAVTGSELLVSTDFPKGWTSSIEPAGTDWLTITENGASSEAGSKTLKFDLKENNTLGDRFARIIVKAGNLKKTIYISQDVFSINSGTVNVTPWDDLTGWDKDTQFDGYYFLSSDKAFYTLYKHAQLNIPLTVSADHPGKWKASVTGGNSWLSITDDGLLSATVNGNITTGTLKFSVAENNTQLDRTEGEITIYSGSLKKVIRVKQISSFYSSVNNGVIDWKTNPVNGSIGIKNYTLALSRTSCKYDRYKKTRTLTVTGSGGGSWKASVSLVSGADYPWITLNTATGAADGTGTELKYTVEPNTGSATRSAKIRVTLYNLCKEILIEQYPNAAIEFSNLATSYKKDDSVIQSFTVVSRAPWKAAVTSDAGSLVQQLRNSSGLANTAGEEFRFTLNTISGSTELKATITFSSIDEEFDPYTVIVTGK